MIKDISPNDSEHKFYELSEFDEIVLKIVYEEVNGSIDKSIPEYQVYLSLGKEFDPDTSKQNIITKTIINLINIGLLNNDIRTDYSKKSLLVMNIYLTLEGKVYIENMQ